MDYRNYLSFDNGRGLLIPSYDNFVLSSYGINVKDFSNLSDLIFYVNSFLESIVDLESEEELEDVISHLSELYYYSSVNK